MVVKVKKVLGVKLEYDRDRKRNEVFIKLIMEVGVPSDSFFSSPAIRQALREVEAEKDGWIGQFRCKIVNGTTLQWIDYYPYDRIHKRGNPKEFGHTLLQGTKIASLAEKKVLTKLKHLYPSLSMVEHLNILGERATQLLKRGHTEDEVYGRYSLESAQKRLSNILDSYERLQRMRRTKPLAARFGLPRVVNLFKRSRFK
jgi:hypothetical protein